MERKFEKIHIGSIKKIYSKREVQKQSIRFIMFVIALSIFFIVYVFLFAFNLFNISYDYNRERYFAMSAFIFLALVTFVSSVVMIKSQLKYKNYITFILTNGFLTDGLVINLESILKYEGRMYKDKWWHNVEYKYVDKENVTHTSKAYFSTGTTKLSDYNEGTTINVAFYNGESVIVEF